MNKNNYNHHGTSTPLSRNEQMRSIAGDLSEVHSLLSLLCNELGGGGIVQASHLQPIIADAVPRLRDAVTAMNSLTCGTAAGFDGHPGPHQNPLLM